MSVYLPSFVVVRLRSWAAKQPEIGRLYVFGSRVRGIDKDGGPVRPDSDLDIAIELTAAVENPTSFWMHDIAPWREELGRLIPYRLHLELLDSETVSNRKHVDESGVLVFDRDKPVM